MPYVVVAITMLLVFSSNLGPRPLIQTVNPKPLSMLILWSKAFHANPKSNAYRTKAHRRASSSQSTVTTLLVVATTTTPVQKTANYCFLELAAACLSTTSLSIDHQRGLSLTCNKQVAWLRFSEAAIDERNCPQHQPALFCHTNVHQAARVSTV